MRVVGFLLPEDESQSGVEVEVAEFLLPEEEFQSGVVVEAQAQAGE